jgi:hypothetical protein
MNLSIQYCYLSLSLVTLVEANVYTQWSHLCDLSRKLDLPLFLQFPLPAWLGPKDNNITVGS